MAVGELIITAVKLLPESPKEDIINLKKEEEEEEEEKEEEQEEEKRGCPKSIIIP